MRLYLVQHGEALAKEVDADRPLSDVGRADIRHVAGFLLGHALPGLVLHSGKTRARETALLLAETLAPGQEVLEIDGIKPNDDCSYLVEHLKRSTGDLLVVGHLPYMARLAAHLLSGSEATPALDYQPGSVVCLASDDTDKWRLQWMLRPALLRRNKVDVLT